MFFQNAYQGRNDWWRWLLTITGTLIVFFLGQFPFFVFLGFEMQRLGLSEAAFSGSSVPEGIDRNILLLFSLLPYLFAFAALWLLITRLHRKPMRAVMTGRPRFSWRRAALGFGIWFGLLAIGSFLLLPDDAYSYQFDPAKFWPLVLVALVLIPIQTTAEEVFFRGYLMQGISLVARNKLVPLIMVTVLFTVMHFWNPEFQFDQVTGLLIYLSVSILLGAAAVLDDGLELPCGIHAANNLFLSVVLSYDDGSFVTDSIFSTSMAALMKWSPYAEIVLSAVTLLLLAHIFGWRAAKLFEPTRPDMLPRTAQG